MPNYCNNTLVLVGSNELLNNFWIENRSLDKKEEKQEYLSFNKSVPIPENYEDWYNWNLTNWGTKWDAFECYSNEVNSIHDNLDKEITTLIYQFDTAWGPPIIWLQKIASIYNNISFTLEYSEPGMDFWGKKEYINGELFEENECSLSDYNWSKIDMGFLNSVIEKYINELKDENIQEKAEEIYEEYINEHEYLENISEHIEDLLKELIK